MKELTLKRIIKKYSETSVESSTAATEKEARLKKIKDRLREMGLIL
jgi:recombinational DNA repair protein RecT